MKKDFSFTTKIAGCISEIDRKEWESIFPDILESYGFLKTNDEALSHQFKPYYVSIYEGTRMVCVAPCFIMDYPLITTIEGPLKEIALKLPAFVQRFFSLRVLICGSAACEGRIGIDGSCDQEAVMAHLAEVLSSIAKKERASITAFKDFSGQFTPLLDGLRKIGFYKILSYPSVDLDIRFNTFEEYIASLSRATKKDLKRKFKRIDAMPRIEMEAVDHLDEPLLSDAYRLYLETFKKSDVQFEKISKAFFKNISVNMPGRVKFFLWRLKEKLVAVDLCLVSEDVLVDEYIGMDYAVAYEYHLYFLTFRDIINWCMERGIKKYETGALNYDPKKRLDFRFLSNYLYIRHESPIKNPFFGLVIMLLKPDNFDPVLKFVKKRSENGKG